MNRNFCHLFGVVLLGWATSNVWAGTILYNNLADTAYVNSQLTQSEYQSFSSGGTTLYLDDLKLDLGKQGADSGTFTIGLYSDSSATPGTLLLTIAVVSDTSLSTTVTSYDFAVADYGLSANTRYWIGLIPNGSIDGTWDAARVTGGDTGTSGQFIDLGGNVYGTDANDAFQMTVDAVVSQSSVPEPSTGLLLCAGFAALWRVARADRSQRSRL